MRKALELEDVAESIGVPPTTLKRWTRTGYFPGIHLGRGHWVVRPDDLDAWLEERRSASRRAASVNQRSVRRRRA